MLGLLSVCVFERSSKYIDLLSVSFMWWCAETSGSNVGKNFFGLTWNSLTCGNGGQPGSIRPSFQCLGLVKQRASLLQSDSCCMAGDQLPGEPLWAGGAGAVPGTLGRWWHGWSVSTGLIFLQGKGSHCQKTAVLPTHLWCECVCTHQQGVTK